MKVEELIHLTLEAVRRKFYEEKPREFLRDRTALMKAVARYGHECDRRGWPFEAQAIMSGVMGVLLDIQRRDADVKYMPIYLESAIDRHIRQHAEELSEEGKLARTATAKAVRSLPKPQVVREQTDVEVLSKLYVHLESQQKAKRKAKKPAAEQPSLF